MDSDIYANPKVAEFVDAHGQKGLAALAVWQFAIQYSGAHATDGQIHKAVLRMIHGTPAHARLLVEGGFLDQRDDGWIVRGYTDHQPTRKTTEELSRIRSEAGRKGAEKRWRGDEE
jgi:hypothetical protein